MKSLPYGKRGETALPALLFFSFVSLAFTAVSHAADAGNCRAPEEEVRAEGVYEGLECGDFCVITIKGKDRDYQAVADDEVRDILPAEGKKISLILRKKGFLRGGACAEAWFAAPAGEEKDAGTDADRGADEARHPENHGDGRHGGLEDYSLRDISADYGDTQGSAGSADRRAPQMPSSSGLTAAWSAGQSSESGSPRLRRSFPWTSWTRSRPAARRGRQCSARQGSRRRPRLDPCLVHQSS